MSAYDAALARALALPGVTPVIGERNAGRVTFFLADGRRAVAHTHREEILVNGLLLDWPQLEVQAREARRVRAGAVL